MKYRKLRIFGDDPASGNVRQYSVKDLLLTTAYAASGMWCAMYFVRMVDTDKSKLVAALGCMFALFGAAFLTPFKRSLMGAAIGLAIFLFLALVALTS